MSVYTGLIDKSYQNRKIYKANTIKISNELNHLGQQNIEIITVAPDKSIKIKQYKLYPHQLQELIEKNKQSHNPSIIQYINSDNQVYYDINKINTDTDTNLFSHPEYSGMEKALHLNSYKETIDIKNNNTIKHPNSNMDVLGFDNNYNNFGNFLNEDTISSINDISKQYRSQDYTKNNNCNTNG